MKRDSKPIGGIGPGQGLSVKQAVTARAMRMKKQARQRTARLAFQDTVKKIFNQQ